MCGIFFSLSSGGFLEPEDETVEQLQARGPDCWQSHRVTVRKHEISDDLTADGSSAYRLHFLSTVLALRGSTIQRQPMVDEQTRSVLCWNGEAWKMDGTIVEGNDTSSIFQLLLAAAGEPLPETQQCVVAALASISGPFSFVFFDAPSSNLYYGRDRYGRRSLMMSDNNGETLALSSVSRATSTTDTEVETEGIYNINIQGSKDITRQLFPWTSATPTVNQSITLDAPEQQPISANIVNDVERKLSSSLRLRVADVPSLATTTPAPSTAKVAVLFSGGIDCTILARMTHDLLHPSEAIDLLNVAFYNPRSVAANPSGSSPYEACPDRVTGRSSFNELQRICPSRLWRFIAVDIPYDEVVQYRPLIARLMYPQNTEMDLSIAMALFFASRGLGTAIESSPRGEHSTPDEAKSYTTTARVLLSGLGADELFAGYTRHSTAFARHGYSALTDELQLDIERIGKRNLGRDDRVISYWGREVRYPYLDEDFVRFALGLNVWEKCGFGLPPNTHDLDPAKQLLRLLAVKLGLEGAAREKKRAIQFGARTAKMEIGQGKRKGTDVLLL